MLMEQKVTVIGAGASGLMAAICAARQGAFATVLEHRQEAGIKLALTGNGRCNYTNTGIGSPHYHAEDPNFVAQILQRFSYADCIRFFREIGIEPLVRHYPYDDLGYVYPEGMDAAAFRDRLKSTAAALGVRLCLGMEDSEVLERCREILRKREEEPSRKLILATGSNAFPATGSDSSLYPLIRELGLSFRTFLPALCALHSKDPALQELAGRRIRGEAVLELRQGPCVSRYSCSGEIQFTRHSISGIPVMQLSRHAAIALREGKEVFLTAAGRRFAIHRTAGFDRAQSCSGGIALSEIDPDTMEMRRHPGVYACGELLDIDGECGGFHLHLAWATGFIAGNAAGRRN